jgi:DNA polymerase elongation subunit (family B)
MMQKLKEIDLTKFLIIDIETVPQFKAYEDLPDKARELWDKKMKYHMQEGMSARILYNRAGIYSEFGKIVCISAGFFTAENNPELRIKAFYGDDEKVLLQEFCEMINTNFSSDGNIFAGHNVREFDFPYIARRCLVNGLEIPSALDTPGKKPWEVQHLDTMDLWKFGDIKSYTSLDLLAYIFNIDSPKSDIDGSMIYRVYWEENDIERIKNYCMRDVATVAQLLLRFRGMDILSQEKIKFVN